MSEPLPLTLARQIAPILSPFDWGIGGSTLLNRLGLEAHPNDLDIVVHEAHFEDAALRLSNRFGAYRQPRSDVFVSRHFARFDTPLGIGLDVMAGIAVRTPGGIVRWTFVPTRIRHDDGLPWMLPVDWRELYALFGRPARVALLDEYLAAGQ